MTEQARWPNLFIVGAAKSGTHSLYAYLKAHPEVFVSPRPEPHYFSGIDLHPKLEVLDKKIVTEDQYLANFKGAQNARIVAEKSTSYLWEPGSALRIRQKCPDAKIIILLREPIARAHSHYLHNVREAVDSRSFLQAIEEELASEDRNDLLFWYRYVGASRYCEQVRRYLELFGSQVRVAYAEDFYSDPAASFLETCRFLGIQLYPPSPRSLEPQNAFGLPRNRFVRSMFASRTARALGRLLVPPSSRWKVKEPLLKRPEKPPIDPRAVEILEKEFRDEARCLGNLVGISPPWQRGRDEP